MDSALVAAAANEIKAECERLREEIPRLRQILIDHPIEPDPPLPKGEAPFSPNLPSLILTTPQKIKLFRSLFRGRDDVYAARWESPDGRPGYSPVSSVIGRPKAPSALRIGSESTKTPGGTFR